MTDQPMGAHVEIVETIREPNRDQVLATLPCIKPRRVRVNGVDVGLFKKDSVEVHMGDDHEPASVTITLYPRTVEMKAE